PVESALAAEATSTYHLELVEMAHAMGHTVYLVDGFRLHNYRKSVGGRAKTDRTDAELLVRYLKNEGEDLRPWSPPPKAYRAIQQLLGRRATLVSARIALQQSFGNMKGLGTSLKAVIRQIERLDQLIRKRLKAALKEHGWAEDYRRCIQVEGIGELTASALVTTFRRGTFRSSDAFIAFLGLDVRARDSGVSKGRRKLTKQGNPELRRLLHNAAMAARNSPTWRPVYERYLERGLKTTQALVALARKLARVAFALMKNQTQYQPKCA
ncbi:IS110 family transposase, partial [Natronospira sp.]